MNEVTLITAGDPITLTLDDARLNEVQQAFNTAQSFAHATSETETVTINMRQVIALQVVRNVEAPDAHEQAAPEETPDEPADTRTVAELKEALDAAGVDYPSSALKADLQQLASDNNV